MPAGDREGALAEAKALARLSHPNVVPIYDVGIAGDHVYLVMELVRGQTLGRWAAGRRRNEVIDAYQQAGAALAAAHRAGLVHRDFKPDNAIVGGDRRVRVVDFGLACEVDDPDQPAVRERRIAGTPRYMAPEQARGAAVTPAADQYSFCVALEEALAESADPVAPRWVAAVIDRGRAPDPAARFESMSQLVKALARDPARVWRRRVAAAVLAMVIAAVAFGAGLRNGDPPAAEACAGAEGELAHAWSPAARAAALARLDELGAYGHSVRATIGPRLDDHAARWITGSRAACLDHRRGAQSDTLFDLRSACLARGLTAWTTLSEIVATVEARNLAEVPRAVQALPEPAACADIAALVSTVSPPPAAVANRVGDVARQIARARVQLASGRFADARQIAAGAAAEARALGYPPLIAEALVVQGHATMEPERRAAVPVLTEAQDLAISSGADALAIEAWARRAWALGTSTDPAAALAGLEVVAALAKRTTATAFSRALLYNNIGGVELARDERNVELARDARVRARAAFEAALGHAKGVTGAGALELVNARANLALVTDERGRADELLREAIAIATDRLGSDHPDSLRLRALGAGVIADTAAAAALEPVCRGYELHPGLAARAVTCWTEVGFLGLELGDRPRAIAALESAVRRGAGGDVAMPAGYLALVRGDAATAVKRFGAAGAKLEREPTAGWWIGLLRGELRLGLGRAQRALGRARDARHTLETSIADLDEAVRGHPYATYERRLHRARMELAALDAIHAP